MAQQSHEYGRNGGKGDAVQNTSNFGGSGWVYSSARGWCCACTANDAEYHADGYESLNEADDFDIDHREGLVSSKRVDIKVVSNLVSFELKRETHDREMRSSVAKSKGDRPIESNTIAVLSMDSFFLLYAISWKIDSKMQIT